MMTWFAKLRKTKKSIRSFLPTLEQLSRGLSTMSRKSNNSWKKRASKGKTTIFMPMQLFTEWSCLLLIILNLSRLRTELIQSAFQAIKWLEPQCLAESFSRKRHTPNHSKLRLSTLLQRTKLSQVLETEYRPWSCGKQSIHTQRKISSLKSPSASTTPIT